MNKLLERQLKRTFGSLERVPADIAQFLNLVSETYEHNEEDRAMIERSLEISSKELSDLNHKLQLESSALRMKLNELENINKLAIDKELKLMDLKKRLATLEEEVIKTNNHEEIPAGAAQSTIAQ